MPASGAAMRERTTVTWHRLPARKIDSCGDRVKWRQASRLNARSNRKSLSYEVKSQQCLLSDVKPNLQ